MRVSDHMYLDAYVVTLCVGAGQCEGACAFLEGRARCTGYTDAYPGM